MLRGEIGRLTAAVIFMAFLSTLSVAESIESLIAKADSLAAADNSQAALPYSVRAVNLAENIYGRFAPEMLDPLINLIMCSIDLRDCVGVDSLCTWADSIIVASDHPDSTALELTLKYWTKAKFCMGRMEEGLKICKEWLAVEKAYRGPLHSHTADALYWLAEFYNRFSDDDLAIATAKEAIRVAESCPDKTPEQRATCVAGLATIYRQRGDLLTADSLQARALEIRQEEDDPVSISAQQINLGSLYLAQDRLAEAEPILRSAYETRIKFLGPEHPVVATASALLATLYWRYGNFARAETLFKEALAIKRKSNEINYLGLARILVEMGLFYHDTGRYDNAQGCYDTALTTLTDSKAGNWPGEVAMCLNRIGNLQRDLGDLEYADSCISRALAIRSEINGKNNLVTSYSMVSLGQLYLKMDRLEEAESLLTDGAAILKASLGPLHPSYSDANISLAKLYALKNEPDRSRECYADALEANWRATKAAFVASSERDKLNWLRKRPLMDQSLLTLAAGPNGQPWTRTALEMVLRGKCAVIDAVAAVRESAFCANDSSIDKALKGRADVCREIANISLGHIPRSWRKDVEDSLKSLYAILDSVESDIGRRCSEFKNARAGQNITLDDIIAAIPDGSVFWEFVRYIPYDHHAAVTDAPDPRYLAFVLTRDGHYRTVDIGRANRIDSLVSSARTMMDGAGARAYGRFASYLENQLKDTLAQLYSAIFVPLRRLSQDCRTIIIAPDGALNLIPFEIMVDSSGAYAVESYTISYASSARDLVLRGHRPPPSSAVVIVSNPDFDDPPEEDPRYAIFSTFEKDDWSPTTPRAFRTAVDCLGGEFAALPFTRHEAERVCNSFLRAGRGKIVTLEGTRASEQSLKHLDVPPDVLHIATHGFACFPDSTDLDSPAENPLVKYGLVLAGANLVSGPESQSFPSSVDDGILTALEVSGLNLVGTELVTLSACETGTGDLMGGEGVFGLRRSFLHAGACSIVMSMFAVPDESTAELMERFYVNWLSGQPKVTALRNASLSILQERRMKAESTYPLFWGGFVLVGDPD